MKRFILKYLIVSFSVFLMLPACVKDMEIDVPEISKEVVVTCLFNPHDKWELSLSETKNIQENEDIYIENAKVEITAETGEIIALDYTGENGVYRSDDYPEMGKSYTLTVNIPGHNEISAESTVPDFVKATVPDFEIKWVKYLYPNDLLDYDVFPLQVNFGETVQDARFLFRSYYFDPKEGYKRFMLTMESLDTLKDEGLPEGAYREIAKLVNQWLVNQWAFDPIIFDFVEELDSINRLYHLLHQKLKQKTVSTREYEAFKRSVCFGNDFWLNNVSYDVLTTIGETENVNHAKLLYANANLKYSMEQNNSLDEEFWLEAIQASKDYIEYYRTYILQVSQRINPYSEPVMVHSNINNATGIFAGYNRQMLYLFYY
ncbi:MAG: DUF4249 family protein [Draconibacterium sp.]